MGFPILRHWYAVYPAGRQLSVVARAFLDYLLGGGRGRRRRLCVYEEVANRVKAVKTKNRIINALENVGRLLFIKQASSRYVNTYTS